MISFFHARFNGIDVFHQKSMLNLFDHSNVDSNPSFYRSRGKMNVNWVPMPVARGISLGSLLGLYLNPNRLEQIRRVQMQKFLVHQFISYYSVLYGFMPFYRSQRGLSNGAKFIKIR